MGKSNSGGNAMQLALRKSGYRLLAKSPRWPRIKGPAAVRIDCNTGYAAQFLRGSLVAGMNQR